MALQIEQLPLTSRSLERFERVLRDAPDEWNRLRAAVDDDRGRLFRAVFNGRSVGVLLLHETDEGAELETLVVHPATRGRGVGRALLEHAAAVVNASPALPPHCRNPAES